MIFGYFERYAKRTGRLKRSGRPSLKSRVESRMSWVMQSTACR